MRTVVELPPFLRRVGRLLSDDELAALVLHLAQNPTAGDLIQGTGGWRKVRWQAKGKGKSGGVRVITFYRAPHRVYLGAIYSKSERASLTDAQKAALKTLTAALD